MTRIAALQMVSAPDVAANLDAALDAAPYALRAGAQALAYAAVRQQGSGQALIKAMGLYPPGSFVELSSGELGVVVSRGKRANLPLVASLVTATGSPLGEPILRDTAVSRFAVKSSVNRTRIKVRPAHGRLIALI